MTPFEADILRYMERRNGTPTSLDNLINQFSITTGYCNLVLKSLKKKLLVEQDRRYYRTTKTAQDALTDFDDRFKYIPFEGKSKW